MVGGTGEHENESRDFVKSSSFEPRREPVRTVFSKIYINNNKKFSQAESTVREKFGHPAVVGMIILKRIW